MHKQNRFTTFHQSLLTLRWIDICCLIFGVVLMSEFYHLAALNFFSSEGLHERLIELSQLTSNRWIKALQIQTAQYSTLLAPLCLATLLLTACGLLLLIRRSAMMIACALIFFVYFIFHLSSNTTWLFEYLLPFLFSLTISMAKLADKVLQGQQAKWLGLKLSSSPKRWPKLMLSALLLSLLFIFTLMAHNAADVTPAVALLSCLSSFILLTINFFLDNKREDRKSHAEELAALQSQHPRLYALHRVPWLDIMTLIIGSMLVFQMVENHLLNWFTVEGYQGLINIYRDYTGSFGLTSLMNYAIKHADVFIAVQIAVEGIIALLLMTLLFRLPTIFFAFGLFATLTYVEFGVPASWPISSSYEGTWLWELLLCTVMTFIILLYQWARFMLANNHEERWLGSPVFGQMRFAHRFWMALFSALLLAGVIIAANEVAKFNLILAITSSLNLFFYLMVLAVVDLGRKGGEPLSPA